MRKFLPFLIVLFLIGCVDAGVNPSLYDAYDSSSGTAIAAATQAQQIGMRLTDTAVAPIVSITQTAAGLIVEQTQVASARTSTALSWTPTPSETPSITPTPTPNLTATLDAYLLVGKQKTIENDGKRDDLEVERERLMNYFYAALTPLSFLLVATIVIWVAFIWLRRQRYVPATVDARGNLLPIYDVVDGIAHDVDLQKYPTAGMRREDLKQISPTAGHEQAHIKENDQKIDLASRYLPGHTNELRKAILQDAARQPELPDNSMLKMPLPGWQLISQWNGGPLPIGQGSQGLITASAASPHILTAGITGAGKTRYLLRPMTAAALVNGMQAIILSLSGNGYGVFDGHPNAYRIELKNPKDVIPYLQRAYHELRERDKLIGGRDLTWDRWPGGTPPKPNMLLVLDELGNMAEAIYTDEGDPAACKELWNWITMLAREGRKVGIQFLAAIQEPTARSVDLRFRRNCTRVAFQLADMNSSQTLLGTIGAEKLSPGYFMALVNGVAYGGGFSPSDEEISAFLKSRPVQKLPNPEWIEGKIIESGLTSTVQGDVAKNVSDPKTDDGLNAVIIGAYLDFINRKEFPVWAQIEKAAYGQARGGSYFNLIKKVIAEYEHVSVEELDMEIRRTIGITTTQGATTGKIAGSEPLAV